jgi:hypothetical protein
MCSILSYALVLDESNHHYSDTTDVSVFRLPGPVTV